MGYEMDWSDKVEYCEELLAEDYKIDKHTAHRIIRDLEIEDDVVEAYKEEIAEKEKEQEEKDTKEIEMNKDLYFGDIHGGV